MTENIEFIERISKIGKELNNLENEYVNLYKEYEGNKFEFQNKVASEVENIVLQLTHEISTEIQFGIQKLELLIKFINFRKKNNKYTEIEISNLIDNNELSATQKILYNKKGSIRNIKSDWNIQFENVDYEKVKTKLGLLS